MLDREFNRDRVSAFSMSNLESELAPVLGQYWWALISYGISGSLLLGYVKGLKFSLSTSFTITPSLGCAAKTQARSAISAGVIAAVTEGAHDDQHDLLIASITTGSTLARQVILNNALLINNTLNLSMLTHKSDVSALVIPIQIGASFLSFKFTSKPITLIDGAHWDA